MALVHAGTGILINVTYMQKPHGGWHFGESYNYRKGVLKEENTYIFIFSDQQKKLYETFCEGILEEGWDVIYSKVAMNTVHPGHNRIFMVIIEKKTE